MHHNPHHEEVVVEEHYYDKYDTVDDQTRLGFVRKVYGIVFAQLALTVAFVIVCIQNRDVKTVTRTYSNGDKITFF